MHSDDGKHDWLHGVGYHGDVTLPVGTYPVTFEARSHHHETVTLAAGSITVAPPPTPTPKATPTPTPTPKPIATPKPKPKPQPKPDPKPTAEPAGRARVTTKPAPKPTPKAVPQSAAEPALAPAPLFEPPTRSATAPVTPAPSRVTSRRCGARAADRLGWRVRRRAVRGGTGGGAGPPAGPATVGAARRRADRERSALTCPTCPPAAAVSRPLVTTTGVATASMAIGLFGRGGATTRSPDRRRCSPPTRRARGRRRRRSADRRRATDATPRPRTTTTPWTRRRRRTPERTIEAALPRWRRPSLHAGAQGGPASATEPAAPRLLFDGGLPATLAGQERRLIRYTVVRLLDAPDELRGRRDRRRSARATRSCSSRRQGAYWLVVLCPDGGRGWIHKMTLGDGRSAAATVVRCPDRHACRSPPRAGRWATDVDDGRPGRLPRLAPPQRLTSGAGSLRSTMMCWCAMFGTNARG